MLEAQWQEQVVKLATLCGWRHFHPYSMRRSDPGWPDLALWRPRTQEFFLAELKTDRGRLSPDQKRVIADLEACGLEVRVWRPRDFREVATRLGARV